MSLQTIPVGTIVKVIRKDPDDDWWIDNMDATIGHTFTIIDVDEDDNRYFQLNTSTFENDEYYTMTDFWYCISELEIIDDECDFNTNDVFDIGGLLL